jgi:hypothetical protein
MISTTTPRLLEATMKHLIGFSIFAVLLAVPPAASQPSATGQDKAQAAKAKATALENLKKCKVEKPTVIETDRFIVAGSMSEEKAKALGVVLEKTLTLARKAAKFEEKDAAWKGKLTVYFLPESDEFKAFMRRILQTSPEGVFADMRAELPILVDPADMPGTPTDADLYAATAARVAGELLQAKGTGTQVIPPWLRDGFGRTTAMRAEGVTSKRYLAYKKAAQALLGGRAGKTPVLEDVWSDSKSAAGELMATSFADFLAYGPRANDFGKFLEALRPSEAVQNPTVQQNGFESLGWKDQVAPDAAWKKWVLTGK